MLCPFYISMLSGSSLRRKGQTKRGPTRKRFLPRCIVHPPPLRVERVVVGKLVKAPLMLKASLVDISCKKKADGERLCLRINCSRLYL